METKKIGKNKILFVLKRRHDYNGVIHSQIGTSTGLYNSASYMNDMLNDLGIESNIVVVKDNNDIDREVVKYKPTHVIIEALWVVPEKFKILTKIHPKVKWIIRIHSNLPFLSNEGISMRWLGEYVEYPGVYVSANSPKIISDLDFYLKNKMGWSKHETNEKILYLPNYYPQEYKEKDFDDRSEIVNICCFGAIRPFKNHLVQAFAAIKFADKTGKTLKFHINIGRTEQRGEPILKNLVDLFKQLGHVDYELVNHDWMPKDEFLKLCGEMDLGMQVSLSETFNIVAADVISQGVPVVGSSEIPWLDSRYAANPTDTDEIYKLLLSTYKSPKSNVKRNQKSLTEYTNESREIWINYFSKEWDTNKPGWFR